MHIPVRELVSQAVMTLRGITAQAGDSGQHPGQAASHCHFLVLQDSSTTSCSSYLHALQQANQVQTVGGGHVAMHLQRQADQGQSSGRLPHDFRVFGRLP